MGTSPRRPTAPEGTETTPVDPTSPERDRADDVIGRNSKEITKGEESKGMPLPGQANDHSTVASDASQKAGQKDPQQMPERTDEPSPPQRNNSSK
jgi:hypothetical protein